MCLTLTHVGMHGLCARETPWDTASAEDLSFSARLSNACCQLHIE